MSANARHAGDLDRDLGAIPEDCPVGVVEKCSPFAAAAMPFPMDVELALLAIGLYGYKLEKYRFGIAQVVAAAEEVGRIWTLRRASPRLRVGDISQDGGGTIPHGLHKFGHDIDMD